MNARLLSAFLLGLLLSLTAPIASWAATPTETATQVRNQWAEAKKAYEAAIKPYANKPEHAALLKQYGDTLDKTNQALERYLELKLASPPTPANKITPVVDQLAGNLATLRRLQRGAKGGLVTVLGTALAQHNQVAQNALKNMR